MSVPNGKSVSVTPHPPRPRNLRPLDTEEDEMIVQFIKTQPPGIIRKAQWESFVAKVPKTEAREAYQRDPEHALKSWMTKYAIRKADYDVLAGRDPNFKEPTPSTPQLRLLNTEDDRRIVDFLRLQSPGTVRQDQFEQLTAQHPHFSWRGWMGKYNTRRDEYDILAGRDPKARGHTPPRDVIPAGSEPPALTTQDEEDRILIRFLKSQSPGIIRNEAFQQLAKREPRHDWATWIVIYSSRRTKLDDFAGRTPSASASSNTFESSVDMTGQKRPLDTNVATNDDKRHPVEPAHKRAREIAPTAMQTSGAAAVTQTQTIALPTAKSTDAPAPVPGRHPSYNEVRGVTFDEATLMSFLESQPDTGPPSSAWDTLAKEHPSKDAETWRSIYLAEPLKYDALAGRTFLTGPSITGSTAPPHALVPAKKNGVENDTPAHDTSSTVPTRGRPLQPKAQNKTSTPPKQGGSDPKKSVISTSVATKKNSKSSTFTEEDIALLIEFIREQPRGPLTWHTFQQLAQRAPHRNTASWYGKYMSDSKFFDQKAGHVNYKKDKHSFFTPISKLKSSENLTGSESAAATTKDSTVVAIRTTATESGSQKKKRKIDDLVAARPIPAASTVSKTTRSETGSGALSDALASSSSSSSSSMSMDIDPIDPERARVARTDSSFTPAQAVLKALGWFEVGWSDQYNPGVALRMKRFNHLAHFRGRKYLKVYDHEVAAFEKNGDIPDSRTTKARKVSTTPSTPPSFRPNERNVAQTKPLATIDPLICSDPDKYMDALSEADCAAVGRAKPGTALSYI